MTVTFAQILSILSLLIAAAALFRNLKGDAKTDAGEITTVIVKLEAVSENVKEIKADMKDARVDMKDVRSDINVMKERLAAVEQSAKSAHKRIDDLEKDE